MENIESFFKNEWSIRLINSIIILLISFVLYKQITYLLNKKTGRNKSKLLNSSKGKAYIKPIKKLIRNIFIFITFFLILQVNGININSVLTGVGIIGVIFGLAIQDWLKDIIRGTSILSDEYFHVGDIVRYKNIEGKVLELGLKTTKIKDLATSNIISIANRNIEEIEVVSNFIYVRIPVPYEVSVERAEKAVADIIELVKKNDNVNNCTYKGVADLADSSIQYLLEVDCNQQYKLQVRRDTLRAILIGLANNKIEVPFTQIDIHNK